MFRLLKLFLFIGSVGTLAVLFTVLHLTVGDIFASFLGFAPTGWAILQSDREADRKGGGKGRRSRLSSMLGEHGDASSAWSSRSLLTSSGHGAKAAWSRRSQLTSRCHGDGTRLGVGNGDDTRRVLAACRVQDRNGEFYPFCSPKIFHV